MMRSVRQLFVASLLCLVVATTSYGHHSWAHYHWARYDITVHLEDG